MVQRHRKFFSYTVLAGMIFNLLSPLFLLPWQQVWACFGSWDCGGNAYCAGAGSYPDHPGSCASYGERGNNDRTTSEIAQDYINNGGNPAEVVTRTQDFQGALSNNDAAAAAARAQELAVAEAQRIAAEQAAAANAAAAAAAAKAADDKAKAEAQRLAQEAAERAARAAANAAAAATAMTPLSGAAPAGTPAAGATVPAAAIPASATGAACGSSSHNACSPNSDGNWYRCNNGSWQSAPDCKPAGAINCVSGCAGANGCMPEGTPATYNGVAKICQAGRWENKGTIRPVIPQDPNPEEAIETWMATEDGGLANRGSARPTVTAPTTAASPPTSAPIPTQRSKDDAAMFPTTAPTTNISPIQRTAEQEQVLEKFRCGEKGGTWTNDTCLIPGQPSPTIVPNPTAIIGSPVYPTLTPTTIIPIPTFAPQSTAGEICRPGIVRNSDGTCANSASNIKIETETVWVGGGTFGRTVKVTTKTFCSGNSAVTQTSRSDGTESSDSKVCEWGCDGGACRPPTIQETAVVRMEVINNAIDLAKVRCEQQGKKDCSTASVYQDAIASADPEEPSPYQVAIRNSGTTAVQRETLIQAEYNKLLREQVELASMGEAGAGMIAGPIDEKGLRQQAERKVDETIAAYQLSEGGGNTPAAVGRGLDKIGELSAEEAQRQIDQQGWLYGTIIAKPMFCGMNNNYRASGACGVEHASVLNEEGLESARAYWTFLITGRTEQALQDIGMIIGDPRSPGFQGRDYNANVALPCGVRSSEGEEEVTDEELACLKGKNVEAQFRLAEVDQQNQTNAVLNVFAAAAGFAGGAIVGGVRATGLVGRTGLFLVREGIVLDVALSPVYAQVNTAPQRAGADALAALAASPDLSQTERETLSELAAQADEEADRAYTENLLMNAASTVVIGAAGSGAGRAAREVFGETWLGRLLLGNLDVPAGRAAAAEVADEANRVIVGGDGTVWNVKPEVVNPRTALQEGELLIISPGERNARIATAAELVNLPEESLVWHRSPDGDEVLHIADSRGDLHVVEPRQRTGQAGGTAGPRAVSAVDIEGVADRVVTTEDVVSAARDTRAALRGETDVLGEQAVVAGVNVPAGVEVGEAAAVARTAIGGQGGIGGIADRAADTVSTIGYNAAGIVDRAGAAVNSALEEDGIVGRMIAGAEQPITNLGRRLETAVDGAVRSTGEAFDAAKVRITGQGVLQTEAVAGKIVDLDDVYSSTVNLKDLQGKTVVISPGDSFKTHNYGDGFRVPVSPREIGGQTGDLIYYQLTIDGLGQPPQLLTGSGIPIPISRDTNIEIKFKAFSPTADPPDNLVSTIIHNVNNNSRIDNATRPPLTNGVQLGPVVYRGWRDISGDLQMPIVRTPAPAAIIVDPNLNTSIPVPISSRTTNVVLGDREIIIGQVDNGYIYFGVDNAPPYLTNSPQSIFDIDGKQYIVVVEVGKGIGGLDNLRRQANVTLVPADGARVAGIKISGTEVSPGGRSQTEVWDKEILFDPTKIQKAEMVYESDIGTMHRSFDFGQPLGVVEAQSEIGLALVDGKAKNLRVEIEGVDGGITTYRISGPYRVELIIRGAGDPIEFTPRGNSVVVPLNSGGGEEGIIPAEKIPEGIGGKVRNAVEEAGERIGQAVGGVREKILPSKLVVSEPEWYEKTIGIDGLQAEVDSLVRQAKDQGMSPRTKITISYFGDDSKLKTINTKLETLATAIRSARENNPFGTSFGDLSIKFGNSGIELGSVSNLSDPQNIVWNVRDIPTKAELNYLITHSADFRQKVALARDIGTIGISAAIGATIAVTGFDISMYNFYYKPTTDKVPLKDPEAALRDMRNLPPNDFRCVGNQIVEISATTDEVLQALETCQNGCSLGMCRARETEACQPGEHLRVSDSLASCSLSCVNGVYTKDFAQCDAIDLSGISTNRYREVVMQTLSILPDDFFPVDKFDKLSIYEVPLAYFSRGDIGDFSPEVNWRDQDIELNGMASQTGEHLLIGRESLSEGLVSGISGTLIHELLHLWVSQSVKPLPEGVPYSFVASMPAELIGGGSPLDYPQVTGCLDGAVGSAFHDKPVDIRAVNCGEDFAYAGTQYVLEACQLKNYSPERYEYFKNEVFRGKEYIPESGCPSQGG